MGITESYVPAYTPIPVYFKSKLKLLNGGFSDENKWVWQLQIQDILVRYLYHEEDGVDTRPYITDRHVACVIFVQFFLKLFDT